MDTHPLFEEIAMFKVENLNVSYGKTNKILSDVSFTLDSGFTFLVGENGSGKTTLVRGITSNICPTVKISLDGKNLLRADLKRCMSYLPQEFDVYPELKIYNLLEFVSIAKGISREKRDKQIRLVAEYTGISAVFNKKMKNCSVGIRRRVGIAASLLGDPKVIILDEPTAGIDPKERIHFYGTIKQFFSNKIVLAATHILSDIENLADYVMMLNHGQISFKGTYSEYSSALNGKLYILNTCDDTLTEEEKKFISNGILLSKKKGETGTIYKVALTETTDKAAGRFCSIQPTQEDLWEYNRGK